MSTLLHQASLPHPAPTVDTRSRFAEMPRERQAAVIKDLREFCELAAIRLREEKTSPASLAVHFKDLCERLTAVANRVGVPMTPYLSPELPVFSALPEMQKEKILQHFSIYLECAETVAPASGKVDSVIFLSKMIQRLGYDACDDVFDKITPDAVVELYTLEGIQIFRSFHFFQHTPFVFKARNGRAIARLGHLKTCKVYRHFETCCGLKLAYLH